jgi:hypothetical protein
MTEAEFTDSILKWAKVYGWRRFHVRGNTRRLIQGDVGFPDLVLLKGDRLIFAELKVAKNKPTPEQAGWLSALSKLTTPRLTNDEVQYRTEIEVHLWHPEQWSEILVALSKP